MAKNHDKRLYNSLNSSLWESLRFYRKREQGGEKKEKVHLLEK